MSHSSSSSNVKQHADSLSKGGTVAGLTLVSRIFGLVRDLLLANLIGASAAADAFFVAFKIPNFFRRLFAEGAFSQAFVPVLSDYRQRDDIEQIRHFIGRVSGTLGIILLVLSVLVVVFPGGVTTVFAYGFRGDELKYTYASDMLRITFPYLLLISMTAMAGAVLNTYDRFAVPAFTPVLLNLCLMASALWIAPQMAVPAYGLAWGVLIAGLVQFLFQLPFLARLHLLPLPGWGWRDPGVQRILRLMVPALFGVSVAQINLLLDTLLASFLPTGSISWLYYSDRLNELPLGVIGIAIATVILPELSRLHLSSGAERFSKTLVWAGRTVFLFGLPASFALIILAQPILATLFFYGQFSETDLTMATFSLRAYASGLLGFMFVKILAPGYFSREDMKTPVRIGIIALAANMVFNLILAAWLHFNYGLGHVGLALATSLSAWLNAGLLYLGLRRAGYMVRQGWNLAGLWFFIRTLIAASVMAVVLIVFLHIWKGWLVWPVLVRVWHMLALCALGLGVYGLTLWLLGLRARALRNID